jgi:RHS repeat-associated protein
MVTHELVASTGNTLVSEGASPSSFGFSTKPQDTESGLYYYGYRFYDPVTGRWPSRDPIGERGGVNLYGFVGNYGVNTWDVLGNYSYWLVEKTSGVAPEPGRYFSWNLFGSKLTQIDISFNDDGGFANGRAQKWKVAPGRPSATIKATAYLKLKLWCDQETGDIRSDLADGANVRNRSDPDASAVAMIDLKKSGKVAHASFQAAASIGNIVVSGQFGGSGSFGESGLGVSGSVTITPPSGPTTLTDTAPATWECKCRDLVGPPAP